MDAAATTTATVRHMGRLAKKNSIVHQLVYLLTHVRPLRQAVWALDPPSAPDPQNLVVQLQRVVRHLRADEGTLQHQRPVDITPLLSAFGWTFQEQYQHTDIFELFHLLMEQLQPNEKADAQFGLSRLFGGELLNVLKWVNFTPTGHQPSSSRTESVFSISLQCTSCSHINDALKMFHASERIDDVLYEPEGVRGDADRSVLWNKLPPVLFLEVRRVNLDFETMQMVAVDNRFEFPTLLDMQPFADPAIIEDEEDGRKRMTYQLAAVTSYYQIPGGVSLHTFVRDIGASNSWVHFSDDQSRVCSEEEAVTNNFGGGGGKIRKVTGLVYVRCDMLPPTTAIDSLKLQAAFQLAQQQEAPDTNPSSGSAGGERVLPNELEELVRAVRKSPYLLPEVIPQHVQDWWKSQ